MAFTLNTASPGVRDYVRMMIPDRIDAGHLFEDEELDLYISLEANDARQAAALACESRASEIAQLRGQETSLEDSRTGAMIAQQLVKRAQTLRMQFLVVLDDAPAAPVARTTTPETPVTPPSVTPLHPVHPGTHNRYIGWSDDDTVDVAELAGGAAFTTDVMTVPARATDGYIWAAFPQMIGYPDSAYIDGNPTNLIGGFMRQAGTIDLGGDPYVAVITNALQAPRSMGRMYTFGFASP